MTFREEFPEFDPATMPSIPAHWEDTSWHNDTCPSFAVEPAKVQVFIEELDPANREFPSGHRFGILSTADATLDHGLLSTDNWDEVLAYVARIESGLRCERVEP